MTTDPSTERAFPTPRYEVVPVVDYDYRGHDDLELASKGELLNHVIALRAVYGHLMEVAVARWHDTFAGYSEDEEGFKHLHDWLEIPFDEYGKWVTNPNHIMVVPDA